MSALKPVKLTYFAVLAEQAGLAEEVRWTTATNASQLYQELQATYGFTLPLSHVKVAINDELVALEQPLQAHDHVVFIPPVAGG
ncbi:MAG: MoaD/ThiS family protein [Gloeomargarita sp. SKYG116]|nr:MoaD/ThiS family protein [Gloeomargarita sp. SKYG116]MCS7292991.1 MoaD/ThiS family protein [Gloeomargarita sp. SKYB120]MDW8178556.1 MoaD/ThiS family protein [Gloeomargarita sp. SKYBB_i_bin120]MDW8401918.1 MoaD/ThiS family protein [Gloeomargarita sp. SKYGB_i_bin116]